MSGQRHIVALHGHGDAPDAISTALRSRLHETVAVVAPEGPVAVAGGRAWFADGDAGELEALVGVIHGALGDEPERAVLVGWSQGAAAALAYALRDGAPRVGGVAVVAGWLPTLEGHRLAVPEGLALLVVHGRDDEVVDPMLGRSVARLAERQGAEVTWVEVDAGHELEAGLEPIATWIDERPG